MREAGIERVVTDRSILSVTLDALMADGQGAVNGRADRMAAHHIGHHRRPCWCVISATI
jgi:hypothetical protein